MRMQVATELGQLPEQVAVEFVDRRGHRGKHTPGGKGAPGLPAAGADPRATPLPR
jgi:hypothetical protein